MPTKRHEIFLSRNFSDSKDFSGSALLAVGCQMPTSLAARGQEARKKHFVGSRNGSCVVDSRFEPRLETHSAWETEPLGLSGAP